MREQFWFIVRTSVATIAVLLMLQIKVSGFSLEYHIRDTFRNSALLVPLQAVTDGGVKLSREAWTATTRFLNGQKSKARSRLSEMKFERHTAPEPTEIDYQTEEID